MEEQMESIIFEIIANAGNAKGIAYLALDLSIEGKIEEAKLKLKEADEFLLNAHKIQTNLIQNEVKGEKTPLSLLLIHAEDHLMSAMEIKTLVSKIIKMNEKINLK